MKNFPQKMGMILWPKYPDSSRPMVDNLGDFRTTADATEHASWPSDAHVILVILPKNESVDTHNIGIIRNYTKISTNFYTTPN